VSEAELALGRLDEAERWAQAAARTADEMGLDGRRGAALAAGAAVLLARGEPKAAAEAAMGAVELLEANGRSAEAARTRVLAGRALAAGGERESAVAELERAHAALGEADAPRLADEAARELRKLGLRVARAGGRAAGHGGLAALSVREREIAKLVSTGSTNREIAGALHLSEKTIANHLSRIFAKLEISSRSALAAAIGREDSPHPTALGAGRDSRVANAPRGARPHRLLVDRPDDGFDETCAHL
jgi:DNA-binding CsgD family transcriptional regulator